MSFEKKFFVALLAVAMLASVGCSRNKKQQQTYVPAGTAVAAPAVDAAAPAPAARRSSTYLK